VYLQCNGTAERQWDGVAPCLTTESGDGKCEANHCKPQINEASCYFCPLEEKTCFRAWESEHELQVLATGFRATAYTLHYDLDLNAVPLASYAPRPEFSCLAFPQGRISVGGGKQDRRGFLYVDRRAGIKFLGDTYDGSS
jgi:hypothetical protein